MLPVFFTIFKRILAIEFQILDSEFRIQLYKPISKRREPPLHRLQ